MAKIKLILGDIDGCLHHNSFLNDKESDFPHMLIRSNQDLLNHIKANIKNYDKTILGYGTNRQSYAIDELNKRSGASCVRTMPVLQDYLSTQLKADNSQCEVIVDPFLMADIYGNLSAGASYEAMLQAQCDKNFSGTHSDWVFDDTKISLIYAHIHRVSALHPNDEIDIDFYDDRLDILKKLQTFFEKNPDLIPKNVTLKLSQYAFGSLTETYRPIQGTAEKADAHYPWSIAYMAAKNSYGLRTPDHNISEIQALKSYYEEKRYFKNKDRFDPPRMSVDSDFDIAAFKAIREDIQKTLEILPIAKQASYTTTNELQQQGLLPSVQIPAQESVAEQKVDDTTAQIIQLFAKYKNKRMQESDFVEIEDQPTVASKLLRNVEMTKEKSTAAKTFIQQISSGNLSHAEITKSLSDLRESNKQIEKKYNKTYWFSRSGLEKKINKAEEILEHAKKTL